MPSARITRIEANDVAEKLYIIFDELLAAGFTRDEALQLLIVTSSSGR